MAALCLGIDGGRHLVHDSLLGGATHDTCSTQASRDCLLVPGSNVASVFLTLFGGTSALYHSLLATSVATLCWCAALFAGVLLCTDLAARGLDIPDVHWIVQFDPPQVRGEHRFASRGLWNCLCKGACANIRFEQSLTTVWRPSWLVSLWASQNVEQCWLITQLDCDPYD